MHKCPNCGQEYEGKFCPECGAQWQEERTCPNCGATLSGSARFCNECGYSLVNKPVKEGILKSDDLSIGSNAQIDNLIGKFYPYLRYIPVLLLTLFSVLLLAFLAAPLAIEPEIGESYGSIYTLSDGILEDLPELQSTITALIIFSVLCCLYTVLIISLRFINVVKYKVKLKKINLLGKVEISLIQLFDYASIVFYLIFFLLGCICCGMISYLDEGVGVISSGGCPILLIAFSIIFALIMAATLFARYYFGKKYPVLTEKENKEYEAEFKKFKNYVSNIPDVVEPVAPVKIEKPVLPKTAVKTVKSKRTAKIFGLLYIVCAIAASNLTNSGLVNNSAQLIFAAIATFLAMIIVLIICSFLPVKKINEEKIFNKTALKTIAILALLSFFASIFVMVYFLIDTVKANYELTDFVDTSFIFPEIPVLILNIALGLASFINSLVVLKRVKLIQKNSREQLNSEMNRYRICNEEYKNYLKQFSKYQKEYRAYRRKIKSLSKLKQIEL